MKEFKHNGITFEVVLPEKIPDNLTAKHIYDQTLSEDQIAMSLACGSDEGEYKARNDDGELLVHVKYKINEEEYVKCVDCVKEDKNGS